MGRFPTFKNPAFSPIGRGVRLCALLFYALFGGVLGGEVISEEGMDKAIATTNSLKKTSLGAVAEEFAVV